MHSAAVIQPQDGLISKGVNMGGESFSRMLSDRASDDLTGVCEYEDSFPLR